MLPDSCHGDHTSVQLEHFKGKTRTSYMSLLFKEKEGGQQLKRWEAASINSALSGSRVF